MRPGAGASSPEYHPRTPSPPSSPEYHPRSPDYHLRSTSPLPLHLPASLLSASSLPQPTATPPIPLKPEDIPADLICSICMGLCVDPVVTPCQHLFCHDCLHQALRHNRDNAQELTCPVDRTVLDRGIVNDDDDEVENAARRLPTGTLLHRIWAGISVQCPHHNLGCAWTGVAGDFDSHIATCPHAQSNPNHLREKVQFLEGELEQWVLRVCSHQAETDRLQEELGRCRAERDARIHPSRFDEVMEGIRQLSSQLKSVLSENQTLRSRPHVEPLFTGSYDFDRFKVVQLSQLISRYLEQKPDHIDANRIYHCIETCYRDLRRQWADNPEDYTLNVRMLLATATASTWFSPAQHRRLQIWMKEQSWSGDE